jgi:hypothetical protein
LYGIVVKLFFFPSRLALIARRESELVRSMELASALSFRIQEKRRPTDSFFVTTVIGARRGSPNRSRKNPAPTMRMTRDRMRLRGLRVTPFKSQKRKNRPRRPATTHLIMNPRR